MRKYPAFESMVEGFLKKSSWNDFLDKLEELWNAKVWNMYIQVTSGKIRDGIIELLKMQDIRGLDVDLLKAFRHIEGNNLEEIRKGVREHCISLLREQIRVGNTFFIDADSMKETELTVLIPDILEARTKEIQNLESKPPLSDVYSTYYGFSILTSGGIVADWGGVPTDTRAQLIGVMQQIGNVENIPAKHLKFSYLSFRNCSDNLKTILWNLLKMSIGGLKSQKAGIEVLGNISDSRAVDLMNSKLENVQDRKVKETLLKNIGKIGSPHSYDVVLAQLEDGRNLDAVKALGSIRDPRVKDVLKGQSTRYYRQNEANYYEALGNTRDPEWLPDLRQQHKRRRRRVISDAVQIAIRKIEAFQDIKNH
ncbi:MAG: HEAT repeat domain-containing protein [Candidatus Thorarchaeota archaeon]